MKFNYHLDCLDILNISKYYLLRLRSRVVCSVIMVPFWFLFCVFIVCVKSTNNTTTLTFSLYIYYNDSDDFMDINLELFKHQLKLSMVSGLELEQDIDRNMDDINICSLYQSGLSNAFITNECAQSVQWV